MRIGFDIDGVLANFVKGYQNLVVEVAGVDYFKPGDIINPPCWNWPEHRGYSPSVMTEVWRRLRSDPTFWFELDPLDGATTLAMCIGDLEQRHDLYFITNREGPDVKGQTEAWLMHHLQIDNPTVLISSAKGLCCEALRLDAYIDDFIDNAMDCGNRVLGERAKGLAEKRLLKFDTKVYLLDYAHNHDGSPFSDTYYTRVRSVGQMLDYLILDL